ncbi:IPT/TIG domain-containing protein [bacterium]|nr:IPT/TIG domain-containing protein [bacterium]
MGCAAPGVTPERVQDLLGQVDFGTRKVQADLDDVANASTVSLIDTGTNTTIKTTVTSASGQFVLTFGNGFKPGTKVYYLEASKGLSNNLAGHDSVRLRTLARFQNGGWVTLTNLQPNVGVRVNLSTTALSVLASLEGTASIPPTGLLGRVSAGVDSSLEPPTPDTFEDSGTGTTNAAFHLVYGLVERLLSNDCDPVAGVVKKADTYALSDDVPLGPPPSLLTVVPASGMVGTLVTLYGTNFAPAAADCSVSFNGVPSAVLSATTTQLTVRVPAGATTGPVSVQTPQGTTAPVAFTVVATASSDIGGSFSAK